MTKSLATRIGQLEGKSDGKWSKSEVAATARVLEERITKLVESFEDQDALISEEQRISTMSPAQHYAWLLRFRKTANLEDVMEMHGRGRTLPRDPISATLAFANELDMQI